MVSNLDIVQTLNDISSAVYAILPTLTIMTKTTQLLVQIELTATFAAPAVSGLDIPEPIRSNTDAGCYEAN